MTPTTFGEASSTLLAQLANPAVRVLALAAAAGLGLAAFRVKATNVRLLTWTAVLYAALAIPLAAWMLPSLQVPTPSFARSVFQSVRQNRIFGAFAEQASAKENAPPQAAERRENAAHSLPRASRGGASRGTGRITDQPQRDGKLARAHTSAPVITGVHAAPSSLASGTMPKTPAVTAAPSLSFLASVPWSAVAAGFYLAVAVFLFVRFFVGLAFSRRLLQASQVIDDQRLTAKLASRAHASGLAIILPAAESEFISVPVTLGALRSTLLLPTAWREWDEAKLDAVVAHEVSHVARRDALTQRLSLLHRAIFWFSPLAWWLDRHLANLAEQASDETALSCGADRKRYATTLLEFFEALQAAPGRVWWQGVSMAQAGQAEKRVERILSWKGTVTMGFKKSAFKKSIVVAAVALAVPLVYLAGSARPANSTAKLQDVYLAQNQTPPPAPRPAPQPSSAPAPAVAPTPEMTPPPEPSAQPEPAPAPHAIVGTITGTIRGGVASVPPAPGVAPVAAIAARGPHAFAAPEPVAPIAAMAPPTPLAIPAGQSGMSHSSHGRGFSYAYDYDDSQRFVIASGKTDSLTMSGSTEDAEHVVKLKKTIPGDFIWFERDEKSYIIRDQATIDRARKLWEPQEELGKKQEALGKQQEALGAQQEELGKKMEQVRVNVPDMTADLDKLKAELKQLSSSATMEQIGNIQSEIGDLQSKIGDLQSKAGDQQSKLGEQMSALGDKQGKLGDEQGKLGDQQAELAQQATRQMKQLLDEAITKGTAQPEP
jgi:beta-lactamase regulating signal transducer with metallopeptidase domain